jgi:hypothetical protein
MTAGVKPPPYTGRCLCGAAEYRVTAEPMTVYACHCTNCQKRSGSAFGISLWVPRTAVEVTKGEVALLAFTGEDGRERRRRHCPRCTTALWLEPVRHEALAIVLGGTLDDTSWLRPVAHLWTRSAQPWLAFPEGAPRYEQQPADMRELIERWAARA